MFRVYIISNSYSIIEHNSYRADTSICALLFSSFSNAAQVSECIDTFVAGCDDATKALVRYNVEQYTSTVLNNECDITSDALDAVPSLSLLDCLEVITSSQINTTEDSCNAVGDYDECVR